MTRLTGGDIRDVSSRLRVYDKNLRRKTGLGLMDLACKAAGVQPHEAVQRVESHLVGVLSMTSGLGVIPGFAESLASIAGFLGFKVHLCTSPDAGGLYEAVQADAKIIITADDDCFIALNLAAGQAAENGQATGRGFAFALDAMAGGVNGKKTLVLGCGPVGKAAAQALLELDAVVAVYDINPEAAREFCQERGASQALNMETALMGHDLIIDATPTAGLIAPRHLGKESMVAAPGVPCGVTPEAFAAHQERIIHDPLQLGTAVMLLSAAVMDRPGEQTN